MEADERDMVILPGIRHTSFLCWGRSWREDPRSQRLMKLNPWIDEHAMIQNGTVIVFPPKGQEIVGFKEIFGTATPEPFRSPRWPGLGPSALIAVFVVLFISVIFIAVSGLQNLFGG